MIKPFKIEDSCQFKAIFKNLISYRKEQLLINSF